MFVSRLRSLFWNVGREKLTLAKIGCSLSSAGCCFGGGISKLGTWNHKMARGLRVLNVAEKNDAAKSLADLMSRGQFRRVSLTIYFIYINIIIIY